MPTPAYRVVRSTETGVRALLPKTLRRRFVYEIPHGQNVLQYRVAILMDLLEDSMTRLRVEAVLRDFLSFTTVRERVVFVTAGDWCGEFWIAETRSSEEDAVALWLSVS